MLLILSLIILTVNTLLDIKLNIKHIHLIFEEVLFPSVVISDICSNK